MKMLLLLLLSSFVYCIAALGRKNSQLAFKNGLRVKATPCAGLSIADDISKFNIDPDSQLLLDSTRVNFDQFCYIVSKWNARFPDKPFLNDEDPENNRKTLCAFLGNANHESAKFVACAEYIQPCTGICSSGYASDYQDQKWGTCYNVPIISADSFELGGSLPANACNTSPTCKDWDDRPYEGTNCWFGRGALQLTWNCNYARANTLISEIGADIDICQEPDSICNNGNTYWAASIAYWMMVVDPVYSQDHNINTAMNCVKNGCSAPYHGDWKGSGYEDRLHWYNNYMTLFSDGSPTIAPSTSPPTAPTVAKECGDWNSICVGCGNCVQCTTDPAKWQCND